MNFGQLADAVARRAGYPVDDPLVTADAVKDCVNEALGLIAADADWPWLRASTSFSTTVGDATYAVPSGWVRTDRIVDSGGEPLVRADARQLEDEYGTQRGTPAFWATDVESDAEVIVLRPIPSTVATFTHVFTRTEKVLSSDTEAPYLPAQFHQGVVALAESLVHEVGRDPKRAESARERYEKLWRPRMQDDRRRSRGPLRVRIRDGSAL